MIRAASQPSRGSGGVVALPAILAAAAMSLAFGPDDPHHRRAVLFAATVCLGGSLAAWLVGLWQSTTPAGRVTASLAALALRLFPALVALAWLQTAGAELRAAGAGELLVFFYLTALAVDLVRTIMKASGKAPRPGSDEAI
jgi:hypothetical protein